MEDKAHQTNDNVNHPAHYGGEDNPYEAIKVIEAWNLGFCLGNSVKYISRAGKKDPAKRIEDLEKAAWYINHEIKRLKKEEDEKEITIDSSNLNDIQWPAVGVEISRLEDSWRAVLKEIKKKE